MSRRLIAGTGAVFLALFLFSGCTVKASADNGGDHHDGDTNISSQGIYADNPYFSHIHGIGFLPDSEIIVVAAHDGLWFYENHAWSRRNLAAHDYMGFASVQDGFYASGHPDLTTELPNPLGLVKVTDDGERLESVRFSGKLDFHSIAAGLSTQSIYLYNGNAVPELPEGLHYSVDGGLLWHGVTGYPSNAEPTRLSAHPMLAGTLALIVSDALYLSNNFGKSFQRIDSTAHPSALSFHPDALRLLFGDQSLHTYNLATGKITPYPSPPLVDDVVSHIAINPADWTQIVIATSNRMIFASHDSGDEWVKIIVSRV